MGPTPADALDPVTASSVSSASYSAAAAEIAAEGAGAGGGAAGGGGGGALQSSLEMVNSSDFSGKLFELPLPFDVLASLVKAETKRQCEEVDEESLLRRYERSHVKTRD